MIARTVPEGVAVEKDDDWIHRRLEVDRLYRHRVSFDKLGDVASNTLYKSTV